MFSAWLNSKLNQFLTVLKQDLDSGAKKQSLDSILSQAMYFGQSFGRVGADFRLSLVPILSQAVLGMISHKKSLITIFDHKHKIKNYIKIQKFHQKNWYFSLKNFNSLRFWFIFGIKLRILNQNCNKID